MPVGAAVHIVTGVPFSGTMGSGVNTFTVPGNQTSTFSLNYVFTVLGGSPNGGYRQVTGSSFAGGVTTVTSVPYSTGTSYPGPTNFTSGSNSVVGFKVITPVTPDNISVGMANVSGTSSIFVLEGNNTYTDWNGSSFVAGSFGGAQGAATMTSVAGSGSSPTYAVGSGGTFLSYNGSTWSTVSVTGGTSDDLTSITFG